MDGKILILCLATCCLAKLARATDDNLDVELVQVIFRHGARTPSAIEVSHINGSKEESYQPWGLYQLTKRGKQQAYRLGCLLRERYDGFLGEYKAKEVHSITTDYTRTHMSLQLALAGLYSPPQNDIWNKALKWKAIPYRVRPIAFDSLLAPHQCPNYKLTYWNEMRDSEYYRQVVANYTDFFNFLSEKTGIAYESDPLMHVSFVAAATTCLRDMRLALPSWCTEAVSETLRRVFSIFLDTMSLTTKLKRLNGGPLIREILDNVSALKRKIHLYATHDLTLAAFLRAHGIAALPTPPFGSAIVLETLRDKRDQKLYLKMLLWDGEDKDFVEAKIDKCQETCAMSQYREIVKDIVPSDEELDFLERDA